MKNIFNLMSHFQNRLIHRPADSFTYGLGAILIMALVLYAQQAWVPGFFHDGYLYAVLGKNAAELGHWLVPFQSESVYARFSEHPPLFFILEGLFFKVFGSDFTQARLFMALWAMLTLVIMYQFLKSELRTQKSKQTAFFACLFLLLTLPFLKKVRFPNLDIPLVFFSTLTYLSFYKASIEGKCKNFLLAGVSLGLAFLIKGLAAVPIIFSLFLYICFSKKFKLLLNPKFWLSLVGAMIIFSLWPLALKLTGNISIFHEYINKQLFNTAIEGRGVAQNSLWIIIKPLVSFCLIWLLLSFISVKKFLTEKKNAPLVLLLLCWILGNLFFIGLIKFKYSHYILPVYPALAILASLGFMERKDKFHLVTANIMKNLFIVVALVMLIFPITNTSSRSKELFKITNILKIHNKSPKNWYVIDNVVDFWGVSNFSSYMFGANPHQKPLAELHLINKNSVYLIHPNQLINIKTKIQGNEIISHEIADNLSIVFLK